VSLNQISQLFVAAATLMGGVTLLVGLFTGDVCLTIIGAVCYVTSFYNLTQVSK
jgi:hypothetical protein